MFELNSKCVVVTGAARGLGQAIAIKFAQAGANIALCDLQEDWLSETLEKVKSLGSRAETYGINVADVENVTEGIKAIESDFGQVDVFLKGVFLCTKAVMRGMMKQRSGTIVNIASVIGLMGNAGQANYAASKGGVISFTKTVAKELASRNVRCNAVAPGFIRTAMTDLLEEDVQIKMKELIPLSRFGEPDDVANVVLFLASDASSYVTGQVLSTCGGMVM